MVADAEHETRNRALAEIHRKRAAILFFVTILAAIAWTTFLRDIESAIIRNAGLGVTFTLAVASFTNMAAHQVHLKEADIHANEQE